MNGGKFLFGLREVIISEGIFACKSILKRNILLWNEDIGKDSIECKPTFKAFENEIDLCVTKIEATTLDPGSEEVGGTIAGFIAKKLAKRCKCSACKMFLTPNSEIEYQYFQLLFMGGLCDIM